MYEPIQPMRFVKRMKQPDAIAMLGCHKVFNNATLVVQCGQQRRYAQRNHHPSYIYPKKHEENDICRAAG